MRPAELGVLLTFDGESFWVAAAHGASARLREATRHGFRPGPHNPFGRAMRGEEFVQIDDVADKIERTALMMGEKIRQQLCLAAPSPQMRVGDEDRPIVSAAVGQRTRRNAGPARGR